MFRDARTGDLHREAGQPRNLRRGARQSSFLLRRGRRLEACVIAARMTPSLRARAARRAPGPKHRNHSHGHLDRPVRGVAEGDRVLKRGARSVLALPAALKRRELFLAMRLQCPDAGGGGRQRPGRVNRAQPACATRTGGTQSGRASQPCARGNSRRTPPQRLRTGNSSPPTTTAPPSPSRGCCRSPPRRRSPG